MFCLGRSACLAARAASQGSRLLYLRLVPNTSKSSETMYCPERVLWSGEVHEHRTYQTTEFADTNSVVSYTVTDGISFPSPLPDSAK